MGKSQRMSLSPEPRRRRPRWHRVYFLLAVFDVLVVAFGLGLNHMLLSVHRDAVRENGVWEERLTRFLDLSDLAANVNAPGNDVFDSGNVPNETRRLEDGLTKYNAMRDRLRRDLDELRPTDAELLGRDLTAVDGRMAEMVAEARQIFGYVNAGRVDVAGTRMASMDRKYHRVNRAITALREDVGKIQRDLFKKQESRARSLQRFEYFIAAFVVLMILCALVYGHRIKRELERREEEKERHIAELERVQADLKASRDELEQRVAERTRDLADANAALNEENQKRQAALDTLGHANTRLESQARRLRESNRDLQDFAYVASHDLQEPLRKILAFSDRIETRYADALDETGRDYFGRMRSATVRMQTLIDDLLVFSRVQTRGNTRQVADLDEVVSGVVADLEVAIDRARAEVVVAELPTIEADPSQMRQLFQNLIANALKFHRPEEAPRIAVGARVVPADADGGGEGEVCIITVADNGIGFAPEYAEQIFTVFQRLHGRGEYEGSGVGLAVCRRIAERHSGSISAHGVPGCGATFTVRLPVAQPFDEEGTNEPDPWLSAVAG